MRKGRDLYHDLDRLIAATTMFSTQELERTMLGDEDDYDDARQEAHEVVSDVLGVIEKSLDEDMLERLDRGEYARVSGALGCVPRVWDWRSLWPYNHGSRTFRGVRPARATQRGGNEMLDEILDDFKADFESRLKKARRDERSITDAELDEALKGLREDLKIIARRSRRREDRREDERETERPATATRKS